MQSCFGWLGFGLVLASPALAALVASEGALGRGVWGGDQLILEVVADGADLEFECARGRITKAVKLDRKGDFDLPGTFSPEGHGPVRDDAGPAAQARYRGHVEGETLTLTVTRGEERMGPFTLTRDRRPILKKCR